jgi:hypothetical protein
MSSIIKITELDQYLSTFELMLDELQTASKNTNNVRLGGSMILKLHGLNFSRPSGDLDVIITNPTEEQKQYLKHLSFFDQNDTSYPNEMNYKFKKQNLCLNILLVENFEEKIENVFYKHKDKYYNIVPIKEIINAKKRYNRSKDIIDFLLLKNENFNI